MKIGIYGGTFNPIHLGHMEAARFAVERLELEKLYLIPTGIPPHKQLGADAPTAEQRLEMVQLAAEEIGPCVHASGIELRRGGRSYTVDTLREMKKRHPKDALFLLMGADMFLSFQNWRAPKKIAELCTLCTFGRGQGDTEEVFTTQQTYLSQTFGTEVVVLSLPKIIDISSTELRAQLKRGVGQEYLSPVVYGYILRKGLYEISADLKNLPLEELRSAALSMLKHTRIPHVLGTERTAAALALRWGADEEAARRAALLHDCTKKFDREQHKAVCRLYGIGLDAEELGQEQLLHAITGAAVAKNVFGVPPEIESAIRWHTTGKADMTLLEKIIYLADYIEPTRDFCDLTRLRELAYKDLDRAMLLGLTMAVADRREKGMTVHSNSVFARDYLKGKLT